MHPVLPKVSRGRDVQLRLTGYLLFKNEKKQKETSKNRTCNKVIHIEHIGSSHVLFACQKHCERFWACCSYGTFGLWTRCLFSPAPPPFHSRIWQLSVIEVVMASRWRGRLWSGLFYFWGWGWGKILSPKWYYATICLLERGSLPSAH